MKLWHLFRDDCSYDEAEKFVIRAKSAKEARTIASRNCGYEGRQTWLDPKRSQCKELKPEGDAQVIVRDFWEA